MISKKIKQAFLIFILIKLAENNVVDILCCCMAKLKYVLNVALIIFIIEFSLEKCVAVGEKIFYIAGNK